MNQIRRGRRITAPALHTAFSAEQTKTQVSEQSVVHEAPACSPDGRWLAVTEFHGIREFSLDNWTIYLVNVNGAKRRKIVDQDILVSRSPDGRRIALIAGRWLTA